MNFRAPAISRRILSLAILALLFHALMPLLMALPAQVGVPMTICSTLGMKTVFVEFDTAGKPAPDKDLQPRCPLCLAGSLLALTPPEEARPALLSGLLHVRVFAALPQVSDAADWPPFHSRAPPLA